MMRLREESMQNSATDPLKDSTAVKSPVLVPGEEAGTPRAGSPPIPAPERDPSRGGRDAGRPGPSREGRRPARERAYVQLKDRILSGGFAPGERLGEVRLAEEYRVSRTPIREALHKLESERLITPRTGGGFVATPNPEGEARELREIRAILEGYALRLISARVTEAALAELEATLGRAETALRTGSLPTLLQWNTRFHELLYAFIADKRRLSKQLISLRQYAHRYRHDMRQGSGEARQELEGHRKIVMALRLRDADVCESLMREHVWHSEENASGG